MATPAQILANQANARRSTGPRTAEGKQASSANAKSHGLTSRSALVSGEDPEEYALFHRSYEDLYLPQNLIQQNMVTELADIEWRLRRVPEIEAQLLNVECRKLTTDPDLMPLIEGLDEHIQIVAVAFQRLSESRALPNLLHHEARLVRRAEKLEKYLHGDARFWRPSVQLLPKYQQTGQKQIGQEQETAAPETENRKNEANSPAAPPPTKAVPFVKPPQPGRNESCSCGSGLKFKRCCLNKPQGNVDSSALVA
jgi:hypothetical protein